MYKFFAIPPSSSKCEVYIPVGGGEKGSNIAAIKAAILESLIDLNKQEIEKQN